ncbi:MAG: hypothetical protein V1495_07680 [Pseudomonadota bacterium]
MAKGFLHTNRDISKFTGKIRIRDLLWTAENIEPRVLEVFPAALIHFPRAFVGYADIPAPLEKLIREIRKGKTPVAEFQGIAVRDMLRWLQLQPADKRTKPLNEIRKNKTFRLRPETIRRLSWLAEKLGQTETRIVEAMVSAKASPLTSDGGS